MIMFLIICQLGDRMFLNQRIKYKIRFISRGNQMDMSSKEVFALNGSYDPGNVGKRA